MEKFHFRTKAGDELVLPHRGAVPGGVWRRLRNVDSNLELTFGLLEGVCTPEQLEVVDRMSLDEINELFGQWNGISAGESSGSSPSSHATEEPSTTTGAPAST